MLRTFDPMIKDHINRAGAGVEGAHRIITSDDPFDGSENEYVYAIETYTDGASFTALEESGEDVAENRLNAGSVAGYPERAVIPGRFTHITPAAGTIVAGFVIKIM